jgi:ATP-dependent DNA helicase RecQ
MSSADLQQVLKTYWGFDDFLPLQREAMQCVLADRDSLAVMPTGGGKSLCYQAPAICRDGLAIVVSPLLALMKDQVDGLRTNGVPAAAVNSTLAADQKRDIVRQIEAGRLRLLYLSPEKLLAPRMLEFLQNQPVTFFAIDEAHCISAWGHDFRPEYRDLGRLRDRFPETAIHAYTATATEQVRRDIIAQLGLRDAELLVGDFRRPNLQYHVARRQRGLNQVCSVLDRFRGQSGIVYCITRADVDKACAVLKQMGFSVLPYHAGMSDAERVHNQEAFLTEQVDTIIATIAFGMGIDKSNVRYVVHAGMPKSLENYQQESGRAGRDGVEAECWLLYSGGDVMKWKRVFEHGSGESRAASERALAKIEAYATSVTCRHASLIEHFGQSWDQGPCHACDVCLGKLEVVDDGLVIGQKILSCVLRVREQCGPDHVSKVLTGSREQRILSARHDQLSTWGALGQFRRTDVRQWIEQLVAQGFLRRVEQDSFYRDGKYHVLHVTDVGRRLLAGHGTPKLTRPPKEMRAQTPAAVLDSSEGVDLGLFDSLRQLRRQEALKRSVPAYIGFSDATLRDMARRRPSTVERMLDVRGVGHQKSADFGEQFVECIVSYCEQHGIAMDVQPDAMQREPSATPSTSAAESFPLFADGLSVEQAAEQLGLAVSTTYGYLESYIRQRRVTDTTRWISRRELEQIAVVIQHARGKRLKPIHDALHGRVSYDRIRIAIACLENQALRDAQVNVEFPPAGT